MSMHVYGWVWTVLACALASAGCAGSDGACACESRCYDDRPRCPINTERQTGQTCEEAKYTVDCGRYSVPADSGCDDVPACTVPEGAADTGVEGDAAASPGDAGVCAVDGGQPVSDSGVSDAGAPADAGCQSANTADAAP